MEKANNCVALFYKFDSSIKDFRSNNNKIIIKLALRIQRLSKLAYTTYNMYVTYANNTNTNL